MNKAIKMKKGYEIILILLFFAAMNFEAKFFYFLFVPFLLIILECNCAVDAVTVVYFLLGLLMGIYNTDEGLKSVLRCFAPLCAYLIGLNLLSYNVHTKTNIQEDLTQKRGFQILTVLASGSFSHYLLNFLYNLNSSIGRNTNDIWTGVPMAATGQNALTCLAFGLACALLFIPWRKWCRWPAIFSISIIMAYNLILSCRTPIIMLFVLILVCLFYPRKDMGYGAQLLKYLKWALLSIATIIAVYISNIGGLRDYIQKSPFILRLGGSVGFLTDNEARSTTKSIYFSQLINYPFGGCHMRAKYGYAHDLLLDAYDEYGLIAFFLLLIVLVVGLKQLYVLLRYTNYSESVKLAFLTTYTATILEFSVEPILTGMPWLLACFCMINGCVTSMNRRSFQYGEKGILQYGIKDFTDQYGLP